MRSGNIHNLDFPLLLCTLAAFAVGVAMVFSATNGDKEYAIRQAVFGLIGLALVFVLVRTDYGVLESFTVPIYLITLALLGVVLVTGRITHGSQRWINLGFFPLQPSELTKLTLVLVLARLLSSPGADDGRWTMDDGRSGSCIDM